MMSRLKKHSLFGRLLFIFTSLIFAILITFILSFKMFGHKPLERIVHKNVVNYVDYLLADLGNDPSLSDLKRVENRTGIAIIDGKLKSKPELPELSSLEKEHRLGEYVFATKYENYKYILYHKGERQVAFAIDLGFDHQFPMVPLLIAGMLSIIWLLLAYHLIDRLFRPIEDIRKGAEQFARGNFDYQIPVKGKGQLAELTRSIRTMGEQISEILESKAELVLAIAHELKTPITRAKLRLDFLEDTHHRKELDYDLTVMTKLVDDILESERMKDNRDPLQCGPVEMKQWLAEIIPSSEEVEFGGEDVNLSIDKLRYEVVVKNLLSNALRFRQSGSKVSVMLTKDSLSVTNLGPTISAEDIDQIMEPFFRVERSRTRNEDGSGTGLGLFLVKQIVDRHGHNIAVTSESGRTTFKISFDLKN
jgi:signal transduction histidine kinase